MPPPCMTHRAVRRILRSLPPPRPVPIAIPHLARLLHLRRLPRRKSLPIAAPTTKSFPSRRPVTLPSSAPSIRARAGTLSHCSLPVSGLPPWHAPQSTNSCSRSFLTCVPAQRVSFHSIPTLYYDIYSR